MATKKKTATKRKTEVPEGTVLARPVFTRVTKDMHAKLEEKAAQYHVNLATFLRWMCEAAADESWKPTQFAA